MTTDLSVTLTRAVIQLVSDPTVSVVCGTGGRGDNYAQQGDFRTYANGVTRLILQTATARTMPVTLRALTPDQVTKVQSMIGKTVLFRDTYGRRVFGAFLATSTVDIPLSGVANSDLLTDIGIEIRMLSYTEAV